MSVFLQPGIYARNPQGGVESIPEHQQAGFKWYAFNIGDHSEQEWGVVIDRCRSLGMPVFPWMRTYNDAQVTTLCDIAKARYGGAAIVNCETELGRQVSCTHIAAQTHGMDAVISGEAWAPNDIDYAPIRHIPIQLQLFPQENDTSRHSRDCRAHYYVDKGCQRVDFMLGIHGVDPTYFPKKLGGYSVYTVDDMNGSYSPWSPESVAPLPASTFPKKTPGYGPDSPNGKPQSKPSPAWKSLKIVMHNAGFGNFGNPDEAYNKALVAAMKRMQTWAGISASGDYGTASYEAIRSLWNATAVMYGPCTYAADDIACNLMRLA